MIAATLTERVYRAIARNPGIRADEIADKLGEQTQDVRLALYRLKRAARVRVKGATRGASYTAVAS